MPDAFTSFAQRSISDLISAANCACVLLVASTPCAAKRSCPSGAFNALTTSEFRRLAIAAGTPDGASNPYHSVIS